MKHFNSMLAVSIIFGCLYGAYQLISFLIVFFKDLQKEVAAAIVAAMTTVVVSVVSVTLGKYFERKMNIEQDQRKKKIELYEKFIEILFCIINNQRTRKALSEKEVLQALLEWTQKLIVWGSNDVIKQWNVVRLQLGETVDAPVGNLFELEKLLIAIRKDMGFSGTYKKGELLSLFINDIDKYVTSNK